MSFYISFQAMINDYGVDLTVTPYDGSDDTKYKWIGGERVPVDDDAKAEPEQRHEPVLPFNTSNSFMAQFVSGGALTQADLLWISTKLYPIQSIVEIPSQPGEKYRIINRSNYQGYSDVVIYELKGDDEHQDGR